MTNSKRCNLRHICTLADTDQCNAICPSFVAMHGLNGVGGRIGAANVPADYRNVTVQDSPARAAQPEAYAMVDSYVDTFTRQFGDPEGRRIKSLYLYSEASGTGKTTTAAAVMNQYALINYAGSLKRGLKPSDRPIYFLDVNAWQTLYVGFNRSNIPREAAEPIAAEYLAIEQRVRTAPFAVLDDIGVRSASEGFRSDLHTVINYRVTNGLPTVYTSNVHMDDLASVFDKRLADRVRDMCLSISFVGESRRGFR